MKQNMVNMSPGDSPRLGLVESPSMPSANAKPKYRRSLANASVGLTALAAVIAVVHGQEKTGTTPQERSASIDVRFLDVLDHTGWETYRVMPGQTPDEIGRMFNGTHNAGGVTEYPGGTESYRLTGAAEIDVAAYIRQQGTGIESDGITPELQGGDSTHTGQLIIVPYLSNATINAINSGKLG